jgi:hypothetical protein
MLKVSHSSHPSAPLSSGGEWEMLFMLTGLEGSVYTNAERTFYEPEVFVATWRSK